MTDRRRRRTPTHRPASDASAEPTPAWTADTIRALGTTTDVVTAGQILGLSRNCAYRLARSGRFPVPIIRAGVQYRVPVHAILTALHLDTAPPPAPVNDAQ
jgi:hypothetical protein